MSYSQIEKYPPSSIMIEIDDLNKTYKELVKLKSREPTNTTWYGEVVTYKLKYYLILRCFNQPTLSNYLFNRSISVSILDYQSLTELTVEDARTILGVYFDALMNLFNPIKSNCCSIL